MSSVEHNRQAIKAFFEAVNQKPIDGKTVEKLFDPDSVSIRAPTITKPRNKIMDGFQKNLDELMPEFHYEVRRTVAEGDEVMVYGVVHGFFKEVLPDPTKEERESVDMFVFNKEGLIIEHRDVQQNSPFAKTVV